MERPQGEALGYTFMTLGAVLLLLQETSIFPKEYEWVSVASLVGGFVLAVSSSWIQHSGRRLPLQNPRDAHDPMETEKGTYQW